MREGGLSAYDADVLVAERANADFFEACGAKAATRAIVDARGLKQVTDTGCDREDRRRDHREEPRQGRAGAGEAATRRLVRRPGDEGFQRQGEAAGGRTIC